jgi:hypothetical protein
LEGFLPHKVLCFSHWWYYAYDMHPLIFSCLGELPFWPQSSPQTHQSGIAFLINCISTQILTFLWYMLLPSSFCIQHFTLGQNFIFIQNPFFFKKFTFFHLFIFLLFLATLFFNHNCIYGRVKQLKIFCSHSLQVSCRLHYHVDFKNTIGTSFFST